MVKRIWGSMEFASDPVRKALFDELFPEIEDFRILGAVDLSARIEDYFETLFRYARRMVDAKIIDPGHLDYSREEWMSSGFHEDEIREVVLKILGYVGLLQKYALKFFIFGVLRRDEILNYNENEEIGFRFRKRIPRGSFRDRQEAASFLEYVADNSGELHGKRAIDYSLECVEYGLKGYPKIDISAFNSSETARRLRRWGTVGWYCNDTEDSHLGNKYRQICIPALQRFREEPGYTDYIKNPMGYVRAEIEKFSAK